MTAFLVLLVLRSMLWADELVLKNGQKVEWTDLHDGGDSYEVTTPQGTKITVKKDDVDRLAKSRLPETLTGATFTFDKKRKLETVDLLARFDPKRDSLTGTWKLNGRVLVGTGPAESQPKVEFNGYTPPEEYDLTVTAERREGDNIFSVILVGGGKQFVASFDWFKGTKNAMGTEVVPGKFFTNKVPRTITFMVRREVVVVRADGKDYMIWKADWKQYTLPEDVFLKEKNTMGIRMVGGNDVYHITAFTVTAPKQ